MKPSNPYDAANFLTKLEAIADYLEIVSKLAQESLDYAQRTADRVRACNKLREEKE